MVVAVAATVASTPGDSAAQGFWIYSGRTHPELDWRVVETEHFLIFYHQGLEATARQTASVAEQVYEPICRQLDTWPGRKTSIALNAYDEVTNGYALHTGQIFIWVHLNDHIDRFSGTEKWLRKVIAHEFQHVVAAEALRTWAGVWGYLGVPAWFVEGIAEYYTETWDVGRSDDALRALTLAGRLGRLDPHDSGFAKVLVLAHTFGDSALVKMVKHRNGLGLYSFSEAFKEATGRSLDDFEEEWRRTMNATYYGYFGQKEDVYQLGDALPVPIRRVRGLAWAPDSSRYAVVGVRDPGMRDRGLYLVGADSLRRVEEVDGGVIGERVSWSPDGASLVYPKYHRGAHGALTWDLRLLDVASGRGRWLTENARSDDPAWSPDGDRIVYTSNPDETTNLYLLDARGAARGPENAGSRRVTNFTGDVQIVAPRWSPHGDWIAFSVFDETSGPDIAVIRPDGSGYRKLTADSLYDFDPLWSPDGERLYFTRYVDATANLYAVPFAGDGTSAEAAGSEAVAVTAGPETPSPPIRPLTDAGEGVWGVDMVPGADCVVALTLPSVDSTRVVQVAGDREAEPTPLALRPAFLDWKRRGPEIAIPRVDPRREVAMEGPRPYRAWRHPRLLGWIALPGVDGVTGLGVGADALGRHMLAAAAHVEWDGAVQSGFLEYTNATLGPLVNVTLSRNWRQGVRMYDRDLLVEDLDGIGVSLVFPFNRGDNLYANHELRFGVDWLTRDPLDEEDFDGRRLPVPEGGKEGVLGVEYRWLRRRPHRENDVLPANGGGVAIRVEKSDPALYGDFAYGRYSAQGFTNVDLGAGQAIFARLKVDALGGDPPRQVFVGVTRDENLYFPRDSVLGFLIDEFTARYETIRLRGWPHVWLGERAAWGTVELRFPLLPEVPVNVFGIGTGRTTGALFGDVASVWNKGETALRTWRGTAGLELQQEVHIGDMTLFVGSAGLGQRAGEWLDGHTDEMEYYLRLALVNPF